MDIKIPDINVPKKEYYIYDKNTIHVPRYLSFSNQRCLRCSSKAGRQVATSKEGISCL